MQILSVAEQTSSYLITDQYTLFHVRRFKQLKGFYPMYFSIYSYFSSFQTKRSSLIGVYNVCHSV